MVRFYGFSHTSTVCDNGDDKKGINSDGINNNIIKKRRGRRRRGGRREEEGGEEGGDECNQCINQYITTFPEKRTNEIVIPFTKLITLQKNDKISYSKQVTSSNIPVYNNPNRNRSSSLWLKQKCIDSTQFALYYGNGKSYDGSKDRESFNASSHISATSSTANSSTTLSNNKFKNIESFLLLYCDIFFQIMVGWIVFILFCCKKYSINSVSLHIVKLFILYQYLFGVYVNGQSTSYTILEDILFDEISNETFGGSISYQIGWKKVIFCNEGKGSILHAFQYLDGGNSSYMKSIAPYAITVKIVPNNTNAADFDNYAVYGKVCLNPIIALNNLKELSYEINPITLEITGQSNINNWYGTTVAKSRLTNTCIANSILVPRQITDYLYHACGNGVGLHLSNDVFICRWVNSNTVGHNIDVYFGFDKNKLFMCDGNGNGDLMSATINPTFDPTFDPTNDPTSNPSKDPTSNPTVFPTNNPSTSPTYIPTTSPTKNPTLFPTSNPTVFPTNNPSISPTNYPTITPSFSPTMATSNPTVSPITSVPTINPTFYPSNVPTITPTNTPNVHLQLHVTINPTMLKANGSIETTSDWNINGTGLTAAQQNNGIDTQLLFIFIFISVFAAIIIVGYILFCIYRKKTKSRLVYIANQTHVGIELNSSPEDEIVMITPSAGAVMTNDDDIVTKIISNAIHTGSQNGMSSNDNDIVEMINTCTEQTDMGGMTTSGNFGKKDKEKHVHVNAILSAVMIQSRQKLEAIAREERNKEEILMQEEGFNLDDIYVDDKSESNEFKENKNQTNKTTGDGSTTTGGVDDVTDGVNVDNQL